MIAHVERAQCGRDVAEHEVEMGRSSPRTRTRLVSMRPDHQRVSLRPQFTDDHVHDTGAIRRVQGRGWGYDDVPERDLRPRASLQALHHPKSCGAVRHMQISGFRQLDVLTILLPQMVVQALRALLAAPVFEGLYDHSPRTVSSSRKRAATTSASPRSTSLVAPISDCSETDWFPRTINAAWILANPSRRTTCCRPGRRCLLPMSACSSA